MTTGTIRTPDQRLRVFISSTLGELAPERDAVDTAVRSLRLIPVRFELGARPHRPDDLYRAYLEQSDVFVGIYWQSYGWVAPSADVSGIEDELRRVGDRPRLIYVKEPSPDREERLAALLGRIRDDGLATYRHFASTGELAELVLDDLAVLVSERFFAGAAPPPDLPSGTLSFLFADVDGSQALAAALGPAYEAVIESFRELVGSVAAAGGGRLVDAQGDGAFCAFPTVDAASLAAVDLQRRLAAEDWPGGATVRARMGIHSGAATRTATGYAGIEVHRAARIAAAANGGQVLLSHDAAQLLERPRLDGGGVVELGSFALDGLDRAESLFQLVAPGLSDERAAPRARAARPVLLPPQLTALVGREEELDRVAALVVRHDVRLVTLTGPGGIGKSRLAIAVAERVADSFPDGVFFVPLAEARSADEVISQLAEALGIRPEGAQPLLDTTRGHLSASRALLVLDNFEQVVDARDVVGALLTGCPGVDVLVTSRIPLRLRGEREHGVPPLAVPAPAADVAEAAASDAVRLFVDRARTGREDWQPSDGDLEAIAEICRMLDGLPLAIELAAARLRVLDAHELLARLDRRLDVVGGSVPDLPARQRTLRATIEWSVDLLSDEERALFRRLAVFSGGWYVDACEEVCEDALVPDVLSSLERLVEHSLVLRDTGSSPGRTRMRMLATIAEVARALLDDAGEREELRGRQAAYFDRLARELHEHAADPAGRDAMARLTDDWDDFRAVMGWRAGRGDHAALVETAGLTWHLVWQSARVGEAVGWLGGAFAARDELAPDMRGELCGLWGAACFQTGRFEEARAVLQEGLVLLEEHGPPDREAWARTMLAGLPPYDDAELEARLEEMSRAVELFRANGHAFGLSTALAMTGTFLTRLGRGGEARPCFDEAIAVAQQLELPELAATNETLKALGLVAVDDLPGARASLERAASSPIYLEGLAYWLEGYAAVAMAEGDAERAATALGAAEGLRERTGIQMWPIVQAAISPRLAPLDDADGVVQTARFEGRQLSPERAMAHVLGARG